MLVSKKVQYHCLPGTITVSDSFSQLIHNKTHIWDTYDWSVHKKIKIENHDRRVVTFRVDKIFSVDDTSSEEFVEDPLDNPNAF